MKQSIISTITNGQLSAKAADMFRAFVKANEGKQVAIELKQYERKRSLAQCRYYFGVVVPAVHDALTERGEIVSPDDVHQYLKGHVGGFMVRVNGKWVIQSSTRLSVKQWNQWLEKIWAWGALNGIQIPQPNEAFNE